MGQQKIRELAEMTSAELVARRRDLKHESLNLRIQQQTGQLENTAALRLNRRQVARIETLLSSRRHSAKEQAAG